MKPPKDIPTPSSPRRIAANRANSALSTGPKTAAGKSISCLNAVRHGLSAGAFVVATEDLDEYISIRNDYMLRFGPRDRVEIDLVDRVVHSSWNLRRSWTLENELLDLQMLRMEAPLAKEYIDLPPEARLAAAVEELAKQPALALIQRYGGHAAYEYHRALKTLMEVMRGVPLAPPGAALDVLNRTKPIPISNRITSPSQNGVI